MNAFSECMECGWVPTCDFCGSEEFTRFNDVYHRCPHCRNVMADENFIAQHNWYAEHAEELRQETAEEQRWEAQHDR